MSVDAGSAVAYLELDYSKYSNGLVKAGELLSLFSNNTLESGLRVQALGGAITGVGQMLNKGLTVPLVGVGAGALTVAANFEEGMSKVQALSGSTASEMELLGEKAKEAGSKTQYSASECADAFSYMSLAGWKANEMIDGLDGVLSLAASSGMQLAQASDIVTDTLSMFNMQVSESNYLADVFAYAQANSNTTVEQLSGALLNCGANANAMGYDIEQTSAMLMVMADQGLKGERAGTALSAVFRDMKNAVKDGNIELNGHKIAVADAEGKYRDMTDILSDVVNATEGLTDVERDMALSTIFGADSVKGMNLMLNAGTDAIKSYDSQLRNAEGSASKMADTMQNNLKGKITQLKSALEGAGIAIGENLIPALTTGVNKITDMVSAFNKLDPATQKTIVSVGATVAAIGPLMMVGGKLVTGIGKTISLVSSVTSLAGSGLVASLGAVAGPLAAVGAGFYTWHEATDAANQSIAVSREEMSFMERMMADLTGMTTYSKDELIEMGLVYKDFNENISTDFQNCVKDMTLDVHDFGLTLAEINVDKVITDEEANNLTTRVNGALESCISAIDTKSSELQDGFSKAFSVDSVIDENETALLEYWNSRGTKEKEEAQKLQSEINNIINTARVEGRELRPEEISAIQNYYAQIKQIELECQASNQYEIEYATQEFQNRVSTMDAESAQQLLGQRFEQYQEQQLATKTNYDTLIAMAQENYEILSEEDKIRVDDTIARLEAAKAEELRVNQEKYDANVDYAIQNNEELANIFNRYNGEKIDRIDLANYQEYEQMRNHYEGIAEITESGYKRVHDTATGTWKDVYVSIDATTGQLKGVYDLNTQNVAAMTKSDESALRDEVAAWNETKAGVLSNCLIMGDAYIDTEGTITDSNNKVIGSLEKVVDANGNLVDAILDTNKTPLDIGDNTEEVIKNLRNTQQEIKNTDGKKAKIIVTDDGTVATVQNKINNIKGTTVTVSAVMQGRVGQHTRGGTWTYATGTENAMPGIASVAEYGAELIVGAGGRMTLATDRQFVNMEGGETVYNARQTQEILSSMDNRNSEQKISKSDVIEAAKLIVSSIKGLDSNIENAIKETGNTTIVGDLGSPIDIDRIPMRELTEEISNYIALNCRGYR